MIDFATIQLSYRNDIVVGLQSSVNVIADHRALHRIVGKSDAVPTQFYHLIKPLRAPTPLSAALPTLQVTGSPLFVNVNNRCNFRMQDFLNISTITKCLQLKWVDNIFHFFEIKK